jgi:nucleotide-binding universal stress UspA family protein
MKNILVPTDYSNVSNNALQYAIDLAKHIEANIILVHAYHVPVPTTDIPVVMISPLELAEENERRIKRQAEEIDFQSKGKVKVKTVVRPGFATEVILEEADANKADLIVMGITGMGNKKGQPLLGSVATSVIKRSLKPVLTIPSEIKFKPVKRIALAYDYKKEMNQNVLHELKSFVKILNAELMIVDVVDPEHVPSVESAITGVKLESALVDVPHTLHFPASEKVITEINSFVESRNCEWLVMIPRKHKLLDSILHKSSTKQMAFHTQTPLLTLHD